MSLEPYRSLVPRQFVPAAHLTPLGFEYIARPTTIGTPLVDTRVVETAVSDSGNCPEQAGISSWSAQIVVAGTDGCRRKRAPE